MIYNIKDYLTDDDILLINNNIQKYNDFDITKNIIINKCSYIKDLNLLLIVNSFNDIHYDVYYDFIKYETEYMFNIINLVSKDIISYLILKGNILDSFFNYKKNILVSYERNNKSISIYYRTTKYVHNYKYEKIIHCNRTKIQYYKKFKNIKIYNMYNIYMYNIYIYDKCHILINFYYKNYKIFLYKKYKFLNIKYNIYKNILI